MSTSTISASVNTTTKTIANARIREAGQTPNGLIKSMWEYIASTGEVPDFNEITEAPDSKRQRAIQRMHQLMGEMPKNTPLSSMTADDVKKELANRDL